MIKPDARQPMSAIHSDPPLASAAESRLEVEHPSSSPLSIHDMTVAYHRRPVIWDIDYNAPAGKLIAIVGPNGAGKTTLINAALGLIPKASGEVRFFGQPLRKMRHRVGYMPQRESVDWDFPVTALDVVTMGLYRQIGWCLPVRRKHRLAAIESLERVGMADFAQRQISQLSGGQQQRVFLARALAQQSDLYLMDEPFAGVDAARSCSTSIDSSSCGAPPTLSITTQRTEPSVCSVCTSCVTPQDNFAPALCASRCCMLGERSSNSSVTSGRLPPASPNQPLESGRLTANTNSAITATRNSRISHWRSRA
jgi:ABC-type molybdenum transport system ATPase subunit/photorepair protein PhrA